MLDVAALKKRAAALWTDHRPTLVAFLVAFLSLVVAFLLFLSPSLAEGPATGTIARRTARLLSILFGPAALLLSLLAAAHAVLRVVGRGVNFDLWKAFACGALALLLPCLFALLDEREGASGGIVGILGRDAILFLFPRLFAIPLLAGMCIVALILGTDWLFYGLLRPRTAGAEGRGEGGVRRRAPAAPRPAPPAGTRIPAPETGASAEPAAGAEEPESPAGEEPVAAEGAEDEAGAGAEPEESEAAPAAVPAIERAPLFPVVAQSVVDTARPKKKPGDAPLPSIDLLEPGRAVDISRIEQTIQHNADILEKTLASFRIDARVVGYTRGPVITMYELALKEGTKLSQIVNLSDDLAIALKAESVRIVAPIPGKNTVGAEVPNLIRDDVRMHDLLKDSSAGGDKMAVPLYLGRDASGRPMIEDLAAMPHLLIAGATGSGKSVCINSIILSILLTRRREEVQLILVDPKQVELAFFREIPHLLTAVVTDPRKAAQTLDWVVSEMEDRYWIFARFGVRNIAAYNRLGAKRIRQLANEHDISEEKAPAYMPYLVVVVDELADLIMTGKKEVEQAVTRLAQKSRAVGIHTVLATQRPSTDVITGLIKANMPCRASFKVTSKTDSRVVLDQNGAEKLLGKGDMLFLPPRAFHLVRCQGTYVSDSEVKAVVDFLKEHAPQPELKELLVRPETLDERDPREVDDLFDTACRIVLESQRGSASLLQRALQIGYTRASRLIDLMRSQGIIGEFKNAQAAEVLLTAEEYEARFGPGTAPSQDS